MHSECHMSRHVSHLNHHRLNAMQRISLDTTPEKVDHSGSRGHVNVFNPSIFSLKRHARVEDQVTKGFFKSNCNLGSILQ